jgi:hypothetical protein
MKRLQAIPITNRSNSRIPRYTGFVKPRQISKVSSETKDGFQIKALLDSGAQETCIPEEYENSLPVRSVKYSRKNPAPIAMKTASGEMMEVTSRSDFKHEFLRAVYGVRGLDGALVSANKIQEQGGMIYLIPRDLIPGVGGVVVDCDNKVQWLVNHELNANLGDMGEYGDITINPPDFSQLFPVNIKPFTSVIYGLGNLPIKDLVMFVQRTFFKSKKNLKWMADNILGFPVTSNQIDKYWEKDICYIRGHMKRRKVDANQFVSRDDLDDADVSDDDTSNKKKKSSKEKDNNQTKPLLNYKSADDTYK